MRVIDRLFHFLDHGRISAHQFEKACGLSNGYLYKQSKGKGSIGSEILEKIHARYPDLNLFWLITGKGDMLESFFSEAPPLQTRVSEAENEYISRDEMIALLRDKVHLLQSSNSDKERIIRLLEKTEPV
jgi:transcriptional regulator with XRE-family HTH domain